MSVTLKRRYKRRYILVLCSSSSEELLSITRSKAANMFGYILAQNAFLGEILSVLTLIDNEHAAVVLDISGTLKSMRARVVIKKNVLEAVLGSLDGSPRK